MYNISRFDLFETFLVLLSRAPISLLKVAERFVPNYVFVRRVNNILLLLVLIEKMRERDTLLIFLWDPISNVIIQYFRS
jgi:hypothetical protein